MSNDYTTKMLGSNAEQKALAYLLTQGMTAITTNFHSPFGEIDLIMKDKEDIVFVEVRSRSRLDYGSPLETITEHKQKKIIKTAIHFLQKRCWLYKVNSRFDVVAIQLINGKMQIKWLKHAFEKKR